MKEFKTENERNKMMSNKLRQRVSRLFIFFLFLIFGRRHVKFLFKTLREILWIAETNRIGNFGDINERLFQECTRMFKPDVANKLYWGETGHCFHFSI